MYHDLENFGRNVFRHYARKPDEFNEEPSINMKKTCFGQEDMAC